MHAVVTRAVVSQAFMRPPWACARPIPFSRFLRPMLAPMLEAQRLRPWRDVARCPLNRSATATVWVSPRELQNFRCCP
jgi:hypothetical protein